MPEDIPPPALPALARPALTIADLVDDGLASAADAPVLERVARDFRLRLTPQMRAASTRSAGVARQFVPSAAELIQRPEDMIDPIGDDTHSPVPGLTHRYPDRVIVHVTKTCEVYCRFCFRRETVGDTGHLPPDQLDAALEYIAATPAISEVILTGGDPLVLSARRIADLMARLAKIDHVALVRLHTRVPVVAPDRISAALVDALRLHPSVWVVVHTNHADELTDPARAALGRLADAGLPLLSQTVLLRGVNDDADVLEALFRALLRLRVKPYYLHHCDLARGAGHFRTTIAAGQAIMAALRGRLSGTALPTYVLDIPGGHGKVPIGPDYLTRDGDGDGWVVTDPMGNAHVYHDPST
jgi:lysine 2,3-aminomutase